MKTGIELIAEERQRQIDVEGYSEQHDSQHKVSEFVYAAIAYVESAKVGVNCAEMGNTNEDEIIHQADSCIFESVFTDSLGKPADDKALQRKLEWLDKVGTHNMEGIFKYLKNH